MTPTSPNYYLGRVYDPKTKATTSEKLLLDPTNLRTHAIVTGMTGSGKTGLCIGLLEEAALHSIPAIIIDPKGDLTNLVLHFPDQLPSDFKPWIDPEAAKRLNKTVDQMATETAETWKKGLADWDLGYEQLKGLGDSADYEIFTPGSSAGTPINVLSTFDSPDINWDNDLESLHERVASIVIALLELIGFSNVDPLRSREYILLSTLIEKAWRAKQPLPLHELILQVQTPPIERFGAFETNVFFPEKERIELSLLLNNFLISPSFQIWQEGQTLDIGAILKSEDEKPRHSIFYIAHLNDKERMFFVTMLFASIESWMRAQRGTESIRALVYFDEILGYLPPIANPPSKNLILRMLKMARAYGIGLVLATQNPVDLDYKALSNAGTWMIGRLQTQQDKNRLMDGLTAASGDIDISKLDNLISGLQKRVFVHHSIYKPAPVLFNTRWALNYLSGPMTRDQIPQANDLVGAKAPTALRIPADSAQTSGAEPVDSKRAAVSSGAVGTRPAIPGNIAEYFMPNNIGFSEAAAAANLATSASAEGIVYRASLFLQSEVRYLSRQYNLDHARKVSAMLDDPGSGLIKWENITGEGMDIQRLESNPLPRSQFHPPAGWLGNSRKTTDIQKDFQEWLYRTSSQKVKANTALKVYATPGMTSADFLARCTEAARTAREVDRSKVETAFTAKIAALQRKIDSQALDVKSAESQVNQRRVEGLVTGGSAIVGMLTGRKRSISSTVSKVRMTSAAKDRLTAEEETFKQYNAQMVELKARMEEDLKAVDDKWENVVSQVTEVSISPTKSDIFSEVFGVAWVPFYLVEQGGKTLELPAFAH
jgi:hypothetical protein